MYVSIIGDTAQQKTDLSQKKPPDSQYICLLSQSQLGRGSAG